MKNDRLQQTDYNRVIIKRAQLHNHKHSGVFVGVGIVPSANEIFGVFVGENRGQLIRMSIPVDSAPNPVDGELTEKEKIKALRNVLLCPSSDLPGELSDLIKNKAIDELIKLAEDPEYKLF